MADCQTEWGKADAPAFIGGHLLCFLFLTARGYNNIKVLLGELMDTNVECKMHLT